MRKGKTVIGQSVISLADGRKLETINDLLISEQSDSIVALLVDEGGMLSSSRIVPIEAIQSFGRDAVVVRDAKSVTTTGADPEAKAILKRKQQLLGKRVLTDRGDLLGSVSDMYFDERTGRIEGFEVSAGVLDDFARGASYLAVDEIERMGPDVIFVRPETGEGLEGQVGGVLGRLDQAGNKVGDAFYRTSDQIGERIREGHPEDALVGRRSGADVTDERGAIVVANGQRIRREHVEWAEQSGNMDLLTRAAATGEARESRARAGAALQEAGDNLGSMWERFTQRISEMHDEQGRKADEQQTRTRLAQIADTIGRPSGKVVLDRSDDVILDFGDTITHQAVQQAYDAGQLDSLLSAALRGQVALTPDQMQVKQPASATVDRAHGGATVVEQLEQKVQQSERERAERLERERREAAQAAQQRERERAERVREREQAEQQRQREIEELRAAGGRPRERATAGEPKEPETGGESRQREGSLSSEAKTAEFRAIGARRNDGGTARRNRTG